MSEVMDDGIIGMPFDMAMCGELSRMQFYARAQSLLAERDELRAELATLKAQLLDTSVVLPERDDLR